jgi:hypothetical protein
MMSSGVAFTVILGVIVVFGFWLWLRRNAPPREPREPRTPQPPTRDI